MWVCVWGGARVGPIGGSSILPSACSATTLLHSIRCYHLSQTKINNFIFFLFSERTYYACLAVVLVLIQPFNPSAMK